jgi:hypothetical protein
MTDLLDAVRGIVHKQRASDVPTQLVEEAGNNKCEPVHLRYEGKAWVLRLRDTDCLPILAELPKEHSVRRLPDFLVFAADEEDETLRVLVCEFKSSAAGVEVAYPQLRLGKLLAEYLVRIAAHSLGRTDVPEPWCSGAIASPTFPTQVLARGKTRPGKVEPPNVLDTSSRMRFFLVPGGTEVHLESFFG